MYRFVFDTNVIVAAMRSPRGASAALLAMALDGQIELAASVALFLEYEKKCLFSVHYEAAGLSQAEAACFVDGLALLLAPVCLHYRWRPALRDADDDMVLEAAVNAQADAIVTFNLRDFGQVPAQFGLDVLTPADIFRKIRHE